MCCRTLLDPAAREVLKPTLLELCRQSFKQLLDKEKAAQAKQVRESFRRHPCLFPWQEGRCSLSCARGFSVYYGFVLLLLCGGDVEPG